MDRIVSKDILNLICPNGSEKHRYCSRIQHLVRKQRHYLFLTTGQNVLEIMVLIKQYPITYLVLPICKRSSSITFGEGQLFWKRIDFTNRIEQKWRNLPMAKVSMQWTKWTLWLFSWIAYQWRHLSKARCQCHPLDCTPMTSCINGQMSVSITK